MSADYPEMHVDYLNPLFDKNERFRTVEHATRLLKGVKFDTFAVRGVSGLWLGSILAYTMNKKIVIVRKSRSTSCFLLEAPEDGVGRYIIVDDLIESGNTIRKIARKIRKQTCESELVGTLLYYDDNANEVTFLDAFETRERANLKKA